jgi:hypothetical protein
MGERSTAIWDASETAFILSAAFKELAMTPMYLKECIKDSTINALDTWLSVPAH